MIVVLASLAIILGIAGYCYLKYSRYVKKQSTKISFKETLALTDLPIVTFYQGDKKFNFLLDTGSDNNHINPALIQNKEIRAQMLPYRNTLFGITGEPIDVKYCEIHLSMNDIHFVDDFMISSLPGIFKGLKEQFGVNVHGVLGTHFFNKYNYIIDFESLMLYNKN